MKLPCDYAILRFLPYPETEEFVNVGVVLVEAKSGFFGFDIAKRWKRVTAFFTELDADIYRAGLGFVRQELQEFEQYFCEGAHAGRLALEFPGMAAAFANLVRPRESLFRYSGIRTVMAENPTKKLADLFDQYVMRQFATEKEYQETVMANRLRKLFAETKLNEFYREHGSLGRDDYEVPVPFIYRRADKVLRAIKPLNLNQESTTKVADHGDMWVSRMRRLRALGALPELMIFPVNEPTEGTKRRAAAREIMTELKNYGAAVVPFNAPETVISLARPT
jgi:Protein of unknown function (DUF3037)